MIWVLTKQRADGVGNAILLHAFSSVEKLQAYKIKHKLSNKSNDTSRYIYLVEKVNLD